MNIRVKRLALFISFSAACLGSAYPAIAADPAATDQTNSSERARPIRDKVAPVVTLNGDASISILQTTVFKDPGATAVDDVDGKLRVRVDGEVNIYWPGTYKLTYTAVDRSGNKGTAVRTVTVVADTTPPVLTLKGESEMSILQGLTFRDPGYTVTDNAPGSRQVKVKVEGYVGIYNPGVYTLTYTAKDMSGNESQVRRVVTVLADTTPPVVTMNGDNPMYVTLRSNYTDPGISATDNSGKPVRISKINTVNVNREGTYVITYFARDHVGNFTRVNRTVIVVKSIPQDTTAPVITLNGAATIELTVGASYTDAGATATDNIDGNVAVTTSGTVNTTTVGSYTLTYTATDRAGNTATKTRTVLVKAAPNQLPTATAGDAQTVNELTAVTLNGSGTDPDGTIASYEWVQTSGPSVTLNHADSAQASFTAPDASTSTELAFKLTVTDNQGATADSTTTVTVKAVDNIKPVVKLNGAASIQINAGSTYTELGATATDDVDGTIPVTISGTVNTNQLGTYTITYTAQDAAGNQADPVTRTITVRVPINTPPIAQAGPDQTVNEQTQVTLTGSGTDPDEDGGISSYVWTQMGGEPAVTLANAGAASTTFMAPDVSVDTTLTFQLMVTDNRGAPGFSTTKVTIKAVDGTKPVITLTGPATIELTVGDTYTDAGATATDNVDGTVTVTTTGSVDTTQAGTYTLTYNAKDAAGNEADPVTRTIVVKAANVAPTTNAGGDQIVNAATLVTLNGTATDSDGTIASYAWTQVGSSNLVSLSNADAAQASFTAPTVTADTVLTFKLVTTDDKGASSEDTVAITVKAADSTKPVITILGDNPATLIVGNTYTDAGATATDDIDTTVTVNSSGSVDSNTMGSYSITYTATDAAGNVATAIRTVNVVAAGNLAPVAIVGAPQIVESGQSTSIDASESNDPDGQIVSYLWTQVGGPAVTLIDETSNVLSITAPVLGANDTPQVLSFKLVVTDDKGATAEATTTVTVKYDITPPSIMLYGPNPLEITVGSGAYNEPGASVSDNVDSQVNYTTEGTVDTNTVGEYIITYSATDAAGNTQTTTRTVSVKPVPNSAPTANAGPSQIVNSEAFVTLDGSQSSDSDGTISSYEWAQQSGERVILSNDLTLQATFTAPTTTTTDKTLVFTLTVTDSAGETDVTWTFVQVKAANPAAITRIQLNDTGITKCASTSSNTLTCGSTVNLNQDAQVGRDYTHNDASDGDAGFSFTKLDANGQALVDQTVNYSSTAWSCVKDNVTGLTWEVKTDDGGVHDKDWTYSWYNTTTSQNNGFAGSQNQGQCQNTVGCDTQAYVQAVNAQNFCGANDWRLASVDEMMSLFNYSYNQYIPTAVASTLDPKYFPYQLVNTYWSANSFMDPFYAWKVNFLSRNVDGFGNKDETLGAILVRGPKY